jgi:hypothetical protein
MKNFLFVSTLLLTFTFLTGVLSGSDLSSEDIKYIEFFKKQGLLPENINEGNISTEKLKELIEYLKRESGIDDIDSIEKPDDRFSSPEKTWELYRSSFLAGDIELANRCLMPDYREKHDAIRKAIGDDIMKRKVEEMKPIDKVVEEDGRAKYRIKRKMGDQDITYYIYFVQVFGNWKISEY